MLVIFVAIFCVVTGRSCVQFFSVTQVISWEGWLFCTSQEIGWEDCLQHDL